MSLRAVLFLCLSLVLCACSGGAGDKTEPQPETADRTGGPQATTAISGPSSEFESPAGHEQSETTWRDPEPGGAHAMAEKVLSEPFSEDKTTRLAMRITRLVDRTTGLRGFDTGIRSEDLSLRDRLARLGAEETELEVRIRLPGSILFDFNSHEIRPDAERTLLDLVEVLSAYAPRPVRIEGHTDSIASPEYNQRLSEQRAAAVRDWLAAHDVHADRLGVVGYGESRPVADNTTAAGRQLNRRVEVVAEKAESPR